MIHRHVRILVGRRTPSVLIRRPLLVGSLPDGLVFLKMKVCVDGCRLHRQAMVEGKRGALLHKRSDFAPALGPGSNLRGSFVTSLAFGLLDGREHDTLTLFEGMASEG